MGLAAVMGLGERQATEPVLSPNLRVGYRGFSFYFFVNFFCPEQGVLNVFANVLSANHLLEIGLVNQFGGLFARAAQN